VNEWGLVGEVKTWWDGAFAANPQWGFSRCELERRVEGGLTRSDLTVMGAGVPKLTGEVRLPDHLLSSPYHPDNLSDAVHKATSAGAPWAFTSDGQVLLLLDTRLTGPPQARVTQQFDLLEFSSRDQLESPAFLAQAREVWLAAIERIGPIVAGLVRPAGMSTDEIFINSLRALLAMPVAAIRDELERRRTSDPAFEQQLIVWMVDDQGWSHDPRRWADELLRAARLTAYVFATRLLFYEALRQAQPGLSHLQMPDGITPAMAARLFRGYFDEARRVSGDYETLFSWDRVSELALLSAAAMPAWERVLNHLTVFDLSTLPFDITGRIFERLIDPHERYRWGQHYTKPEVVDLMLSLGLRDNDGAVLDPAVGGGTFLVRAYARKQALNAALTHQDLLAQLYGLDVSSFAANLATVNLAVRHLAFEDNYPRIAARSFFQVDPSQVLLALPAPKATSLEGATGGVEVRIGEVAAVVCNPPYVRLHELGKDRQREANRILGQSAARVPTPRKLHGLSNYHVYFWLHGAQFLQEGGRLVLITAGEWLDSDYGAALQKWLLDNFAIEALIESFAETWFTEARVGTVVVSARLCRDKDERADNVVRFVALRRPLVDLFGDATSEAEHLGHVDALRDQILALTGTNGESEDLDWSTIRQSDLEELGIAK
jgi:hypothetical protein